jgi:hypothetical protein
MCSVSGLVRSRLIVSLVVRASSTISSSQEHEHIPGKQIHLQESLILRLAELEWVQFGNVIK